MKKNLLILLLISLAASCDKVGSAYVSDDLIVFRFITPEETKAEVTADNISNSSLFVYGNRTDLTNSVSSIVFAKAALTESNGLWKPDTQRNWENSSFYEFYGYAYSSVSDSDGAALTINNQQGTQITVTQPPGDYTKTIDYLSSYRYETTTGTDGNYPVVPLELEHAMAKVSIDLVIAQAMTTLNEIDIEITLNGIRNSAVMSCTPKLYSAQGGNLWMVSNVAETVATYTKEELVSRSDSDKDVIMTDFMSFMAIPMTSGQMSGYELTLSYKVESEVFERTFPLKDVTDGWKNGHCVRYVVTVDNSIHLTGTITDFVETDYIEGTVLPDLG